MAADDRGWQPGSLVELWGEAVIFGDEDAIHSTATEGRLDLTIMGPEDTMGLVLSSRLVRPARSDGSGFVYVLLLVGPHLGWISSRSIRRTWDGVTEPERVVGW